MHETHILFFFHFYDQKYDKKQLKAAKADFVHGLR